MSGYKERQYNMAVSMACDIIKTGMTNKEIAEEYYVNKKTVQRYFKILDNKNEALYLTLKRAQMYRKGVKLAYLVLDQNQTYEQVLEQMGSDYKTGIKQLMAYDFKAFILVKTKFYNNQI